MILFIPFLLIRKWVLCILGGRGTEAVCVLSLMVSIIYRVDWTKTTCADLLGRYFTSVHVRPSVCVVCFILSGDVQGAAPQFGKTTRMLVYLWALGVFFTQLAEVRTA